MTKQAQGHFRAVTSSPQDLAQLEAIMRETFTDTFANEQSAEDLNAFLDKNYNQLVLKRELTDQDSETFFYKVDGYGGHGSPNRFFAGKEVVKVTLTHVICG